jgi:hypothetical protein
VPRDTAMHGLVGRRGVHGHGIAGCAITRRRLHLEAGCPHFGESHERGGTRQVEGETHDTCAAEHTVGAGRGARASSRRECTATAVAAASAGACGAPPTHAATVGEFQHDVRTTAFRDPNPAPDPIPVIGRVYPGIRFDGDAKTVERAALTPFARRVCAPGLTAVPESGRVRWPRSRGACRPTGGLDARHTATRGVQDWCGASPRFPLRDAGASGAAHQQGVAGGQADGTGGGAMRVV